jgi:hypothetical protein
MFTPLNSTGTLRDGNQTIFTPPGPPLPVPTSIPTGTPVQVHTGSGTKSGWMNSGTVVTTNK